MPTARRYQVHLDVSRHYHCISRCVRRAFLCGYDTEAQKSFDHRKQWLIDQMHWLAEVFAIQISAYAVMSNHYHIIFYVNKELALAWSDQEVVERWASLFPMSQAKVWRDLGIDFENLSDDQALHIQRWREQLYDISWFMRKLNEYIARRANKEDDCTGRFWEGRFKSQALLDESALLACMAYVDLNPIRAGISNTPEESEFTSIQERIHSYQAGQTLRASLCVFEDEIASDVNDEFPVQVVLPCTREDYFELVDTTGRLVRQGKTGSIPESLSPILQRLNIKPDSWVDTIVTLSQSFASFMGRPESMEACMVRLERPRMRGLHQSNAIFSSAG